MPTQQCNQAFVALLVYYRMPARLHEQGNYVRYTSVVCSTACAEKVPAVPGEECLLIAGLRCSQIHAQGRGNTILFVLKILILAALCGVMIFCTCMYTRTHKRSACSVSSFER